MKMLQINWIHFTTILSSRIIKEAVVPLDSRERANVLIIDDSMFERNRSKKVELLAKVVYVRNRNKRKEYLWNRWDKEAFFKVCKRYLHLSKECRSTSYAAMTAHTAVVCTRYMMLSLENRESKDERSLGELFLYFSDEMSDIAWIQAFQLMFQMYRTMLADNIDI